MKIESLKPGMTIYDVHSYRMGNTTMRTLGCWNVTVIEVNADRTIIASWNDNKPTRMHERQWSKFRLKKPEFERTVTGRTVLKKRAAPGKTANEVQK